MTTDAPALGARQVVFPTAGSMDLRSTEVPEPGASDFVMRVRRVGICATDLHLFDGHIGDPFPLVPGHEFVGDVARIGADAAAARGLEVGDRIAVEMLLPCGQCSRCREGRYNICERDDPALGPAAAREYGVNISRSVEPGLWGGYADYLWVPAEAIVHRLPADLPWDVAALVEPLAVAFRAVHRGRVAPGDTVVVIGPGPVGLLMAAAAKLSGAARVVMVGTRPSRLALSTRFGADTTIDSQATTDVASAVVAALGSLADVVIEAAGVPSAQTQAATLVRRGGRVVLAGACGWTADVTFGSDRDLLTREIDVLPSFLSAGGYEPSIEALSTGAFPFDELITHRFELEEVQSAFDLVRHKKDGVVKAVLVLSD
ncbi:zinc-dependent alcohol dehydrogenase [Galbitalea soli]|uniref:Alcohol dehydrogenase catalytic domain-containing protein n=1 Tax=Galbitalea soli TaxID=1268042 RepID=A0A7C9PMZ8_9MICO|nr:alcohol dehydrogenase catalytic domain-containing protein [Galbitalea soli]NEM91068.1 alcohol dehydrogenase catalytic domain-containing protein [Galbitalea soli]NYJ29756.1 threonine dehydrogenase-like Zn-dependent dehydrogenase [Galbitalea soli]